MLNGELFSKSFVNQTPMFRRLFHEMADACGEFYRNPKGYISSIFEREALGGRRRRALLKVGLATGILLYGLLFFATLLSWKLGAKLLGAVDDDQHVSLVSIVPKWPLRSSVKAGGGGGGGGEVPTPASLGEEPRYLLRPPVIAPTTSAQLREPSLPIIENVLVDPRLQPKRDELAPTGIRDGVEGPASDGPGKNGGIGEGDKGGIGPDKGPGVGRGCCDGGKGGPGGTGGGLVAEQVDSQPIPLNRPRPNYTEEAMRAKLEGLVRARLLIGADGMVKRVVISRHLPLGLDDEAIRAAYQMRFKPATKNGVPVSFWIPLDIEFTLR